MGASLSPDSQPAQGQQPAAEAPASSGVTESKDASATPDTPSEDQEDLKEIEKVTEVEIYEVKDSCRVDEFGVARAFDNAGKKSVFRPFCDGSSLISFSCEGAKARSSSRNCANGCMLDENRIATCRTQAAPPRNPDPLRTSGSTLDRIWR